MTDSDRAAPDQPTHPTRALATLDEVAEFLRIPAKTLYRWRYRGEGPPAYRVGRHLRFRWRDVERWLATRSDDERTA
jgi:excisionase family DNA binding protein